MIASPRARLLTLALPAVLAFAGCSSVAPTACRVQYLDLGSGGPCSAVAVGPHVALTAGHCLDGIEGEVLLRNGGDTKNGRCDRLPPNRMGEDVDLAVCVFDDPASAPFGPEEIETVSTDLALLAKGTRVVFAGFGCSQGACGDHPRGCLPSARAGRMRILRQPSPSDASFLTVGRMLLGESCLSPGDSGGPVCTRDGHRLLGLNQLGCVNHQKWKSAITSLAAEDTVRWMCGWMAVDRDRRTIDGLDCAGGATVAP